MLFKYCTGRCRQRLRSVPSFLLSGIAELYIGARSVLITRGWGWDRSPSALRNSRLAASASRDADSRKSMVAPLESNRPAQVAPTTLHPDVGFVDSPRLVCRLEMPSQSLLQLRAVILHPAPDRGVVDIETALLQQLLNIAQRQRIAKIPPDRTKYEAGFGLPPFEDRGSGYHFAILSRHQPAALKVATHPFLFAVRHLSGMDRRGSPRVDRQTDGRTENLTRTADRIPDESRRPPGRKRRRRDCENSPREVWAMVVLQVSNADKFVAERLSCVLRLPTRKGCR